MAQKNALIRNLEAVETLGLTTVICTDKTGTITQNLIRVSTLVLGDQECPSAQDGLVQMKGFDEAWAAIALCNNARLSGTSFLGDQTEGAMLVFARQMKPLAELQTRFPRIHESPFDLASKRMITTHRGESGQSKPTYMKVAPEVVFGKCTHSLRQGELVEFDETARQQALKLYESLAVRGELMLALAFKTTDAPEASEKDFTYLGMLDPPRPEFSDAVKKCRTAGIRVFMITGDFHVTAESIARQVGLFSGDGQVVGGEQLQSMNEEALAVLLDSHELVFALVARHGGVSTIELHAEKIYGLSRNWRLRLINSEIKRKVKNG